MVSEQEIKEKVKAHREAKQEEQTETIIVANEDLTKLKQLQAEMDNIIVVFGQIAIQETVLANSKQGAQTALQKLKDRESSLAKELSDKYGQGSLDLETGKFTTTK